MSAGTGHATVFQALRDGKILFLIDVGVALAILILGLLMIRRLRGADWSVISTKVQLNEDKFKVFLKSMAYVMTIFGLLQALPHFISLGQFSETIHLLKMEILAGAVYLQLKLLRQLQNTKE